MKDRKNYWNEDYYKYWKIRVEEANISKQASSTIIKGDTKAPGDDIMEWLITQSKISNGIILEIGCGWGRLFPIYSNLNLSIYAIDISKKMVEEAKKNKIEKLIEVKEAEAEILPYEDNFFDYVSCLATFDATYQEKALFEMFRVLKLDGVLLLTGKNINYCDDDKLAMEAEKGARSKNHPNYFTDVIDLKSQLKEKKHKVLLEYYFIKRGDFSKKQLTNKMPEKFYEYFLLIQKGTEDFKFKKFYSDYSNVKGGR